MSLNRHLWSMDNLMTELTYTHAVTGFNYQKMTINIGSELVKDSALGAEIWRRREGPGIFL